jgi:GMP synthase (glutamine-hydrolysing)
MSTSPSVLLLQARLATDPARTEEVDSFARCSGLPVDSFHSHDLLQGPPTMAEARRFDCLMIGGSGDYYVSKRNLDYFDESLDFLADVSRSGMPVFGSCFGFQCLVEALGGSIEHDPASIEVGTYEVALTDEGENDPLFGQLPPVFWAQLGRKDRAERLPEGCPNLASSERCGM